MFKGQIKIVITILLIFIISAFIIPQLASAQVSVGLGDMEATGLGTRGLKDIIVAIIQIFLGFLGIIAVLLIMYGGYTWMTAAGNADKIEKGKKILINAAIGLVIILSSYAIVTFVVSKFGAAVREQGEVCALPGITEACPQSGDCLRERECSEQGRWGACYITNAPCDPFRQETFRLTRTAPANEQQLLVRNAVIQLTFNNRIADINLETGAEVSQPGGGGEVPIRAEISNSNPKLLKIFPDNQDERYRCPGYEDLNNEIYDEHPNLACFVYQENNNEANLVRVTIIPDRDISFQDSSGRRLTCRVDVPCEFSFQVGGLIDLESPAVDLTEADDGINIYQWNNNNINVSDEGQFIFRAQATDDAGLATVSFIEDDNNIVLGGTLEEEADFYLAESEEFWDIQELGYQAGERYQIVSTVTDYAANEAESQKQVTLRPSHCFNGRLDADLDETGIDCGGSCGACQGELCGQLDVNNQCLNPDNQFCASGLCEQETCLCAPVPEIISIDPPDGAAGNWVTVFGRHFGQTPGRVIISGMDARLPSLTGCIANWQDEQIIIELPDSLEIGNQQIQVVTSQNLTSNYFDFLINEVERPGICFISPAQGAEGDIFNIRGVQFGSEEDERDVYFGLPNQGISALSQYWGSLPNLYEVVGADVPNLAAGQTSVRVQVNGENSNALRFSAQAAVAAQVIINDFTPKAGADGQYVTIYGSGFGDYVPNQSQVKFSTDKQGSFAFPDACGTNFWTDTQIVVKVPDTDEVGELLEQGPLQVIRAGGQTAISRDNFNYRPEAELTPGICSLYPREGEVGSIFEAAGEYFTDASLFLSGRELEEAPLNDNLFRAAVPQGAQSGPVKVTRDDLESNSLDFEVITAEAGGPEQPADYYQWQFRTCENCLIPEVVEIGNCWSGLASPTPLRGNQDNFTNTLISATFNTDMNDGLFSVGETVEIESCGQNIEPANCQSLDVNGNFEFGLSGSNYEYFILDLSDDLNNSTWYKITLQNLASQLENIFMEELYSWYFKTKDDELECQVTSVRVNPYQRTIDNDNPENNKPVYLGEDVWYRSSGYNQENCNICPDTFNWGWSSSDQGKASIDTNSNISRSLLRAQGLTDETAVITAQATDEANNQTFSGEAYLDIVPPRPHIIYDESCNVRDQTPSPWPSTDNACRNAIISVQFNRIMDQASTLNIENFHVADIDTNQEVPGTIEGIYYEVRGEYGLRGVRFIPQSNLRANAAYDVSVTNGQDGVLGIEGGTLEGPRGWVFRTRDRECDFDRVLVDPSSVVLQIETTENYSANTLNSETCEILAEPAGLTWSWRSENQSIAVVQESQTSESVVTAGDQEGQTYIRAQASGIENTGENGLLRVTSGLGLEEGHLILSITENQPAGDNVCLNALARARFNLRLDPTTINSSNFKIHRFNGNDCISGCEVNSQITSNEAGTTVSLVPAENNNLWTALTRYIISVQGGDGQSAIRARTGELLNQEGCDIEAGTWDEQGQTCSWNFTTTRDTCAVEEVQIEPAEATINVGGMQSWEATAISVEGYPLSNQMAGWNAANQTVADATPSEDDSRYASSQGLGVGQTNIFAGALREEGSNQVIWGSSSLQVNEEFSGPQVTNHQPQDDEEDVCRNALIKIEFDKLLDANTVNNNSLKVEYATSSEKVLPGCRQVALNSNQSNIIRRTVISRLFNSFASSLFKDISDWLFKKAYADIYWCPVIGEWAQENHLYKSEVKFMLSNALPALSDIRVTVMGGDQGIKATNGLPLAGELNDEGNYVYSFITRADVCALSLVRVAADQQTGETKWTFTTSFDNPIDNDPADENFDTIRTDRDKRYTAAGFSTEGEELVSIEGVYEWNYQWQSADASVATMLYTNEGTSVVGAQNKNGEADIAATAVFPPVYNKPDLTAKGKAIVDICENRWNPAQDENPNYKYIDPNFTFSLSYCRDAGVHGTQDDLPALELPQVNQQAKGDALLDLLLREYLMPVPTTGDVVGLRIYTNYHHLSPKEWYQRNIEVQGTPVNKTVDGYQAIQDGRTVYVAATNVVPRYVALNTQATTRLAMGFSIKSWLVNLWQNFRANYLDSKLVLEVQAQVANLVNNFNNQNNQLQGLISQFNNGLTPQELNDLLNNIDDLWENYDRQALLNAGVNEDELNAYEANLRNLQIRAEHQLNFEPGGFTASQFGIANEGYQVNGLESGYTNVYLLSYNQNADPKTKEILDRLLERWQFNTNVDNQEVKEKITRDVERLADLGRMARSLNNYHDRNGQYPTLEAGTFISGMSTSKWPYWNQTLGAELGGLPIDPINQFSACINCAEPELLNAGFEEEELVGFREHRLGNNTQVALGINSEDQTYIKEGNRSLGIAVNIDEEEQAEDKGGGIIQGVSLLPNTSYEISAWVYVASGRAYLTFEGSGYGNEWLTPTDYTGWFQLKNRLVTGSNEDSNFIYIYAYSDSRFYVDDVKIQTVGGNCGYDPETCWNPEANGGKGAFACDVESYLYRYQSLGGANYFLAARMETTTDWRPAGYEYLDPHLRLSTERVAGCEAEVFAGYCGDRVVKEPEQCEPFIGLGYDYCLTIDDQAHQWYTPRFLGCEQELEVAHQCQWYDPRRFAHRLCYGLTQAQCCGGYCGDGVWNIQAAGYLTSPDEQCDASAPANNDGFGAGTSQTAQYACDANCHDTGGYCGDGEVQGNYGEDCDGNAAYWDCLGIALDPTCNNSCDAVCPNGRPYQGLCGNNTREGPELCDGTAKPANTNCINYCDGLECSAGYAACDGSMANGCEINISNNVNHCGACNNLCLNRPHTTKSCSGGRCQYQCLAGWANCDNNMNNGCEVDLNNDVNNCGGCGRNCQEEIAGEPAQYVEYLCNGGECSWRCDDSHPVYYEEDNICIVQECGDGYITGPEICDDGEHNGEPLHCNRDCSSFNFWEGVGELIFHDNFNDGNVFEAPNYNNWTRRDPGFEPHAQWTIVDLEDEEGNPYTLQGQVSGACQGSNHWYIKALAQDNYDLSSLIVVTRVQLRGQNQTALILGNYNIDGDGNYDTESGYAVWTNIRINNQVRPLALIKFNGMNVNIRQGGQTLSYMQGSPLNTETWYWVALKINNNGQRAEVKGTYWLHGDQVPAEENWRLVYTDNSPLSGGNFALATWGECATSWFDDFQVYELEEE